MNSEPRAIMMLVYEGFELLDLAGPTGVFNAVNVVTGRPLYRLSVHAARRGAVTSSCGITVDAMGFPEGPAFGAASTTLVVGSEGSHLTAAMKDRDLRACLRRAEAGTGRFGSVCSGAFVLAAGGLLDGRRGATHWAGAAAFARWFPQVALDHEALYVTDGRIWTSAGVTTGIDMALAMVGQDCGAHIKGKAAGHLVMHRHRAGYQTQFSSLLAAQINAEAPFGATVAWAEANLHKEISVDDLARFAGMSPRTFHRRFKAATGQPPARFVLALRMEAARERLICGKPVKAVAPAVGFASEAAFRSAFKGYFGVRPSQLSSKDPA